MHRLKKVGLVLGLAAGLLLVGSGAYAVFTLRSGTVTDQQVILTQTDPWTTAAAAWTDVTGAAVSITVPAGQTRMLDARFTAESACTGNAGYCSVRIVVHDAQTGAIFEMDPVSGMDFAFDSAATDQWEGHAIERSSKFLEPGTYRVRVQGAVVAGATQLRLDDWAFVVGAIRP